MHARKASAATVPMTSICEGAMADAFPLSLDPKDTQLDSEESPFDVKTEEPAAKPDAKSDLKIRSQNLV